MAYSPNQTPVYIRANVGCLAGIAASTRWPTDSNAADYVLPAQAADAFAQELDTLWGTLPVATKYELDALEVACESAWIMRSPLPTNIATTPAVYRPLAKALIAIVQQGNAQVVLQGIDPNADGSGGGGGGGMPVALFIDPAQSTGFAADTNTGQTSNNVPAGTGPILTTAEQNKRIVATPSLIANLNILYMSDDASGVGLDLGPLKEGAFAITVSGTVQTIHTGGALNAGTLTMNASAAGGGQRQTIHATDIADWTPFVPSTFVAGGNADLTRVVDNTTGSSAWLANVGAPAPSAPGNATASVTAPYNNDGTVGALTSGDGYKIIRGSLLTLADSIAPEATTGFITFNDFEFTSSSVGPKMAGQSVVISPTFNRCGFLGQCLVDGFFINCAFANGFGGATLVDLTGGLWEPSLNNQSGVITVTGDTYVSSTLGAGLTVGSGSTNVVVVTSVVGSGMQIQDCRGQNRAGLMLTTGGDFTCEAGLLWGKANAGFGVLVYPGTHAWLNQSTTAPSVTGSHGDFGFFATTGPTTAVIANITVARAWNDATGAYTEAGGVATRSTTWANLVATIAGGGFAGRATCLETDAQIVITGRGA